MITAIYIILILLLIFALIITYFIKRKTSKPDFYRDLAEDTIRYGQTQTFKSTIGEDKNQKFIFTVKSRGFKK